MTVSQPAGPPLLCFTPRQVAGATHVPYPFTKDLVCISSLSPYRRGQGGLRAMKC
ncbi:MAG: hypothetical protein HZB23_00550 [Deltaproteobacteria bacterium]|nr:hypothetical protein [Deltaproteobacteria bacterium]